MKFALINGKKTEATKGARGFCPNCGSELVAKCGEIKVDHWAHKGNRNCDPWWENETDWHRSWKEKFPIDWQEVIHFDDSGEKHIADVKTKSGCVLEFQHSYLKPEERRSRISFYRKLVWVVDGTRRKTDKTQFQKVINESTLVNKEPLIIEVSFPEECRLLKEWHDSRVLVFFDFQEANELKQSALWFLFPKMPTGEAYLSPFCRDKLIELHNNNKFDEFVRKVILPTGKTLYGNKQIIRKRSIRANRQMYLDNKRRKKRRF